MTTGPLRRLIERASNILDVNHHLHQLQLTLDQWRVDASELLRGGPLFSSDVVEIHTDPVYDSLVEESDDVVLETYTQLALELICAGLLIILERQATDQLPGR